jgi:hypothetical protein
MGEREGREGKGRGGWVRKGGEMTQTLYAHINKKKELHCQKTKQNKTFIYCYKNKNKSKQIMK